MATPLPDIGAGSAPAHPRRSGWSVLVAAIASFTLLCLPVVVRGAPLADDFDNCVQPARQGLAGFLQASVERLGAVRPARFLEIFLTVGVCRHLPFAIAIAVPLALTLLVALLLRGLLRDLHVPGPWPEVVGAMWLLQPLGTEAALWPAALHVPLGLALALAALRLHLRGRSGWAAVTALGACLSVEQVVLALPLAVWLTTPPGRRRRATALTASIAVAVTLAYALWPGSDPRLRATLGDRVAGLFADPAFYLQFPAVGVGAQSIPLAVLWAFPISVVLLAVAGALGWRAGPALFAGQEHGSLDRAAVARGALAVASLVLLVNLPLLATVPRQGSPRTFAPTWLVLVAALAVAAPRVHWRWPRGTGATVGLFVAGAVLSLALSVSVRLHTADFTQASSHWLAGRVPDGGVVAVCGIRRTVVEPAPRGAFAIHELIYDWAARDALHYYTSRNASFRLGGPVWGTVCPRTAGADVTVHFDQLRRVAEESR
jgi:hypothetical protein